MCVADSRISKLGVPVVVAKGDLDDWSAIQAIAKKLEPQAAADALAAFVHVQKRMNLDAIAAAVLKGDVDRLRVMADTAWGDTAIPLLGVVNDAFAAGGHVAGKRLGGQLNMQVGFDLLNPRAIDEVEARAADLVTRVGQTTKDGIKLVIDRAFKEGLAPRVAARQIKPLITLLPQHANAVMNLRARLMADGVPSARVDALADRYAAKLLKYRAEMIARQEIMLAQNAGQLRLWQQAIGDGLLPSDQQRKWVLTPDDRLCPLCAQMRGDVAITFVNTPWLTQRGEVMIPQQIHPQCRCTHVLIINVPAARRRVKEQRPLEPQQAKPAKPAKAPKEPKPVFSKPITPTVAAQPIEITPASAATLAQLKDAISEMASATVEHSHVRNGSDSANVTIDVFMKTAGGRQVRAIGKPVEGENWSVGRQSITNTSLSLAEREAMAWEVDQLLGTGLVPTTVLRDVKGSKGSVQRFADNADVQMNWDGRDLTDSERYRLYVLDLAIGNTDRHAGNLMRNLTTGDPIGIDHGYSFPAGNKNDPRGLREFRPKAQSERKGRTLPAPKTDDAFRRLALSNLQSTDWKAWLAEHPSMNTAERKAFLLRIEMLTKALEADALSSLLGRSDYFGRMAVGGGK